MGKKVLRVTADVLVSLMKARAGSVVQVVDNPLPEDVAIADMWAYEDTRVINIMLESAEFPDVPDGAPWPDVDPIAFRTVQSDTD